VASHDRHASASHLKISVPTDPRALHRMRRSLIEARDRGVSFDDAWAEALPAALAGMTGHATREWAEALNATRDGWRAGFAGEQVLRLSAVVD